jgi:hypothetical protein
MMPTSWQRFVPEGRGQPQVATSAVRGMCMQRRASSVKATVGFGLVKTENMYLCSWECIVTPSDMMPSFHGKWWDRAPRLLMVGSKTSLPTASVFGNNLRT